MCLRCSLQRDILSKWIVSNGQISSNQHEDGKMTKQTLQIHIHTRQQILFLYHINRRWPGEATSCTPRIRAPSIHEQNGHLRSNRYPQVKSAILHCQPSLKKDGKSQLGPMIHPNRTFQTSYRQMSPSHTLRETFHCCHRILLHGKQHPTHLINEILRHSSPMSTKTTV